MKRLGKPTPKPKDWSDSEKRLLVELVRKGLSPRAISIEIGRHVGSVKRMAQEMRLVLKRAKKAAN